MIAQGNSNKNNVKNLRMCNVCITHTHTHTHTHTSEYLLAKYSLKTYKEALFLTRKSRE